ncbi:MAG: YkgJ family cysteine cluster protein [Fusicatenibacter sp.]|nr:YkgJ family cysteine cluster protein [Lachnospiraceae bacterium]MDY2937288.1 YkgJ family cysteine cluster protein [Fusicatenibacter sp.]
MERNINLQEETDGKRYSSNDMAKLGCDDCRGCSKCCRGMEDTIVLDPMDIFRLSGWLHQTFEELLQERIGLRVVDGMVLPYLKMDEKKNQCSFLNEQGRCSIHPARPGFCRMFPLGRLYEQESFQYILQIHECPKEHKTKVKIRKWLDTPDLNRYEKFTCTWHYFLKEIQRKSSQVSAENYAKEMNMLMLQTFYVTPYDEGRDFYEQFEERLGKIKEIIQNQ